MLGINGRTVARRVFTPPATWLTRLGVSPNAVTVAGTVVVCGVALWLYPTGHLWLASVLITAVAFTDSLDGTMARLQGTASRWGAFLDSTLDRLADAAIFGGVTMWFVRRGDVVGAGAGLAALVLALTVSYARARAEGLGMNATVGIAERTDRLVVLLITAFLTGLGLSPWVLKGGLLLVAAGAAITVGQRAHAAYRQGRHLPPIAAAPAAPDAAAGPHAPSAPDTPAAPSGPDAPTPGG